MTYAYACLRMHLGPRKNRTYFIKLIISINNNKKGKKREINKNCPLEKKKKRKKGGSGADRIRSRMCILFAALSNFLTASFVFDGRSAAAAAASATVADAAAGLLRVVCSGGGRRRSVGAGRGPVHQIGPGQSVAVDVVVRLFAVSVRLGSAVRRGFRLVGHLHTGTQQTERVNRCIVSMRSSCIIRHDGRV